MPKQTTYQVSNWLTCAVIIMHVDEDLETTSYYALIDDETRRWALIGGDIPKDLIRHVATSVRNTYSAIKKHMEGFSEDTAEHNFLDDRLRVLVENKIGLYLHDEEALVRWVATNIDNSHQIVFYKYYG